MEGLGEGTILLPGLWSLAQEEAVSWHSSWFQSLHFLPVCHWCPSSCCPGATSQREWSCVSPKFAVGPLRGLSWEFPSFFHHSNLRWFLEPEVMGTYLPGIGTLGWVVWSGAGISHSWGILSNFYPTHVDVGLLLLCLHATSPRLSMLLCISSLPICLDECGFFKSLVVRFPYSSIFWWFWVTFVL